MKRTILNLPKKAFTYGYNGYQKNRLFCLVVVLILTVWHPIFSKGIEEASGDSLRQSIHLLAAGNHLVLKGYLNGKSTHFLLDTGASYTVLHSKLSKYFSFELFELPSRNRVAAGVNSNSIQKSFSAINVTLQIGQAGVLKQSYLVQDLTPVVDHIFRSSHVRISGIIGTDFLKKLGCQIDFAQGVLRF